MEDREIHPSAPFASVISPRPFSNGRYGQTEKGRKRQFRFQTPPVLNYNSTKFHYNPCIPSIGSPFPIYFPRASRSFSPSTAGLIGLSRLGLFPALFLMDGTGKRRKGEGGNSVFRPLMSPTSTPPSFSSIPACNLEASRSLTVSPGPSRSFSSRIADLNGLSRLGLLI